MKRRGSNRDYRDAILRKDAKNECDGQDSNKHESTAEVSDIEQTSTRTREQRRSIVSSGNHVDQLTERCEQKTTSNERNTDNILFQMKKRLPPLLSKPLLLRSDQSLWTTLSMLKHWELL